ncbi:YdcH family protein [Desulfovibrio sp. OttesenSCG-928-F07]|nr:YdcH family protein [Desulfovibrio sp. OttesenSCG-928-F07]
MDAKEIQLIEKYAAQDDELRSLWDEHQLFEKQLEKLEAKSYRTPAEDQQMKELKKQKLDGKTKLVTMLDRYRSSEK